MQVMHTFKCTRPSVGRAAARAATSFPSSVQAIVLRRGGHALKVAAIEEQQTDSSQQEAEQGWLYPDSEAQQEAEALELAQLDSSQEDLLKWMLYLDDEAQEEDLDEMVDYEEMGDEEYEEMLEDVEDMLTAEEVEFRVGDKVVGTVYECDEDGAYVEIGAKSAGFVPLAECSLAKLKSVGAAMDWVTVPRVGCRMQHAAMYFVECTNRCARSQIAEWDHVGAC
jgi:hypothetical protein